MTSSGGSRNNASGGSGGGTGPRGERDSAGDGAAGDGLRGGATGDDSGGRDDRDAGEDAPDAKLRAMRAVWLTMRDEEPPDRGLTELLAAARLKAAAMQPQPTAWQRLLAAMRRPQMLAFATVLVLVGGAVLIGRRVIGERPAVHAVGAADTAPRKVDRVSDPNSASSTAGVTSATTTSAPAGSADTAGHGSAALGGDDDGAVPGTPGGRIERAAVTAPPPSSERAPAEAQSVRAAAPTTADTERAMTGRSVSGERAAAAAAKNEQAANAAKGRVVAREHDERATALSSASNGERAGSAPGRSREAALDVRQDVLSAEPAGHAAENRQAQAPAPTQPGGPISEAPRSRTRGKASEAARPEVGGAAGRDAANARAAPREEKPAPPADVPAGTAADVAPSDGELARLHKQCEAAARRGDCAEVRRVVGRITRSDRGYRARIGKDSAVAKCLAEE